MNTVGKIGVLISYLSVLSACGGGSTSSPEPTQAPPSSQIPGAPQTPAPVSSQTPSPSQTPVPTITPSPQATLSTQDTSSFPGSLLLGKPTDRDMTVSIVTEKNAQITLNYGLSSDDLSLVSNTYETIAGMPLEVELDNLQANTQYFYRVNFKEEGEAAFGSNITARFYTQRSSGSEFKFAVHADAHVGIRVRGPDQEEKADDTQYAKTLLNTLGFNPDFLIDLGDTFMSEKNAQRDFYDATDGNDKTPPIDLWVEEDYVFLRSFFNLVGHSLPLYLVNGNHEGESGWVKHEEESVAVWANNYRKELFPEVGPNEFYSASVTQEAFVGTHNGYYAWEWGAALFIALDPFWYAETKPKADNEWAWTLGKEQYDWLKETLENSNATFKFVFLHNLVGGQNASDGTGLGRGGALVSGHWEWGGTNPHTSEYEFDTQRPGWGQPIHTMLVDNDVSVVFHGHDHVFVREDHSDGIIYQAVPQPSVLKDNDNRATQRAEVSGYDVINGVVKGGSGFIGVSVNDSEVNISFVRTIENAIPYESCTVATCSESVYSYNLLKAQ